MRSMCPTLWISAAAEGVTSFSNRTPWEYVRGRVLGGWSNDAMGYLTRDNGTIGWGRNDAPYMIDTNTDASDGWLPETDVAWTWLITDARIDPSAFNSWGYWGIGSDWELLMTRNNQANPLIGLPGVSDQRPWDNETMYAAGDYIDFALVNLTGGDYLIAVRSKSWNGGMIDIKQITGGPWTRTPASREVLFAWTSNSGFALNGSIGESVVLRRSMDRGMLEQWGNDPYNVWYIPEPMPIFVESTGPPPDDVIVNLPAATVNVQGAAPDVVVEGDILADLPAATVNVQGAVPDVVVEGDILADLPAATVNVQGAAPSVAIPDSVLTDLPITYIDVRGYAPGVEILVPADTNIIVDLPAAPIQVTGIAPTVGIANDVFTNLPAAQVGVQGAAPQVNIGDDVLISLPAAQINVQGVVPTVVVETEVLVDLPAASIDVKGNVVDVWVQENVFVDLPAAQIEVQGAVPTTVLVGDVLVNLSAAEIRIVGTGPRVIVGEPDDAVADGGIVHPPTSEVIVESTNEVLT